MFEALGFEVSWNGNTRTVFIEDEDTMVELKVDDSDVRVNSEVLESNFTAKIINGRTLTSIKFISKIEFVQVNWDEKSKIIWINKQLTDIEEYKTSLTYSNLVDKESQAEVRESMEKSGIPKENIDLFFQEVNTFNSIIEETSLVESGFITIEGLEPEYDLYAMQELWDAEEPYFLGYNCRIVSYDLMKDSIKIGKRDRSNNSNLIFDIHALENNPKKIFNEIEQEEFETLYSFIPTEDTKDIRVHLEKVKEDWKKKR